MSSANTLREASKCIFNSDLTGELMQRASRRLINSGVRLDAAAPVQTFLRSHGLIENSRFYSI